VIDNSNIEKLTTRIIARFPDTKLSDDALVALRRIVETMGRDGNGREDPMREIFARLGDAWSTLILQLLGLGTLHAATLRELIGLTSAEGRISKRIMSLGLRRLEYDGLIRRVVAPSKLTRVTYTLTDTGASLVKQVESLMEWTRLHSADIRAAQARLAAAPQLRDH
jgi:DNA-binding HxlR family transcriptional regulator